MSVLDEINALGAANGRTKCTAGLALRKLDDQTRAEAEALLMDPDGPAAAVIGRWLKSKTGVSVAEDAAARHRRGKCICGGS